MVRVDLLIFGYCFVTVEDKDKGVASDILLKNGIGATVDVNGTFIIPYSKRDTVVKTFGDKVSYSISSGRGLLPLLLKNRDRFGVLLGIICFAFLMLLSSDTVWDVRIEGIDRESENDVLEELSDAGLSIGKRWSKINRSQIETNLLAESEKISWININRRGNVAYVKVSDKIIWEEKEEQKSTANIVALRDCVIEEIRVENGYPMVKKGESVKAGDLLISGVIPTELGGGFCYASGVVIGTYNEKIEVVTNNVITEKEYCERSLLSVSLNVFGHKINIFKRYGHYDDMCDIIEEKKDLQLYKKLPVSISKTYVIPYKTESRELSEDECVGICSRELKEKLSVFLADKDTKRLVTKGEFLSDGYRMFCDATVSSPVGKIQEFEVE